MGRAWTTRELDTLRSRYEDQGVTTQEIAKELGRTEAAVYQAVRKLGVSRPRGKRPQTELTLEEKIRWGMLTTRTPGHGTYAYQLGCRCKKCKNANRVAGRKYRRRRKEREVVGKD